MNNLTKRILTAVIGGGLLIAAVVYSHSSFLALVTFLLIVSWMEFIKLNAAHPIASVGMKVFGLIYILFGLGCFAGLVTIKAEYDHRLVLTLLFLLWSNDTGAYLVGRRLGRTKLWTKVSPKKTWEGLAGGFLFASIVAYFLSKYFFQMSIAHALVLALIITIFGTLGDLLESAFKRKIKVKDSGTTLPGHGGVLDRFDSLLLAAPAYYVCLKILMK